MFKALKKFGMGLVYFLISPFILAAIAILAVYGIFNFFYQLIVLLINFFSGKRLFPMTPEDKKAEELRQLKNRKEAGIEEPKKEEEKPQPQQIFVQQNFYQTPPPNGVMPTQIPNQSNNPYIQIPQQQLQQPQEPKLLNQGDVVSEVNIEEEKEEL